MAARQRSEAGVRNSDGQAISSLGAAAVDDGPTVFGLHSDPEAMGPISFGVAGLEGSFAHYRSSFFSLDGVLPGLSLTMRQDGTFFRRAMNLAVSEGRRGNIISRLRQVGMLCMP